MVEQGYRVLLIQPRGIGKSKGDLTPTKITMEVLSKDIKTTLDALKIKKLHVIGHAFGNRLARLFATQHTSYVDKLMLLACGGDFELEEEAKKCLRGSFNLKLPNEERVNMIAYAFFAKNNDASVWLNGWYPKLAKAQVNATLTIDGEVYKKAGAKEFLVVQATEDFIAPPNKAGKALKADLKEQVTYVEVQNAGHALTSEKPDEVAEHILAYLKKK